MTIWIAPILVAKLWRLSVNFSEFGISMYFTDGQFKILFLFFYLEIGKLGEIE